MGLPSQLRARKTRHYNFEQKRAGQAPPYKLPALGLWRRVKFLRQHKFGPLPAPSAGFLWQREGYNVVALLCVEFSVSACCDD